MGTTAPSPVLVVLESLDSVNSTMFRLLVATLKHEKLVAVRDREIAAIQKEHAGAIDKAAGDIALYEAQIEAYCRAHPESFVDEKKSLQLPNGLMGLRTSAPSLQPLNDKWTWEKIEDKLRELWKKRYFHKPKPPGIDKVKVKKELKADQLKECGMKLEATETFYLELNRLAPADESAGEQAA